MYSVLFEEWIRELDSKFEREGGKIVLIVDNCPAQQHVKDLKAINLVFLPPTIMDKFIGTVQRFMFQLSLSHTFWVLLQPPPPIQCCLGETN